MLAQETNLGLAGRNRAAREARSDLLLVLDDDAYPLPGAIETLIERFEPNPRLRLEGGFVRDIDADGGVVRSTELGTFDWWLPRGHGRARRRPKDARILLPEGAAMVRRSAYLEVGGYFEPYFHLGRGIDLTTRLLAAGWDVRYLPQAQFDHMKAQAAARATGRSTTELATTSGTSGCASPRGWRCRARPATWRSTWWTRRISDTQEPGRGRSGTHGRQRELVRGRAAAGFA